MNTQERLQKARQELEEFKQVVQQDTRVMADDYARNLELVRQAQQRDPNLGDLNLGNRAAFGMGEDVSLAMAMGQLSIETRIRALEAQAAREAAMVQVPPQQIVAPPPAVQPPAQKLGLGRRIKNWFKRTFSRKAADAPAPVQAAPVQVQAAPVQVDQDCTAMVPIIDQVQVASRVGEIQRFGKPSNPDPDAPDAIATREEIRKVQKHGARGAEGKYLAERGGPLFAPAMDQVMDMFQALEQTPGFSFAAALSDMKNFSIGVGDVQVNEATIAMTTKAIDMMREYMQNDHMKEYIRLIYQGVGNVLVDNVHNARGPDAMPNDADFDEHVMQILPTRGLESFRDQCTKPGISTDNKRFALQCSKLMSKMSHVVKFCSTCSDADTLALFQPMLTAVHALMDTISQIGAQVRAQRLAEINGGVGGAGSVPPPPANDPPPSIDNPPPA